jgi:hypothetical protein
MNTMQGIVWCSFHSRQEDGSIQASEGQYCHYHLSRIAMGDPAREQKWLGMRVSHILLTLVSMQFQGSAPNDFFFTDQEL